MTALADSPASDVVVREQRLTSRWLWWASVALLMLTVVARLAPLRSYVANKLAESPQVTRQLTDDHLRSLAINVGIGLALIISVILFILYQSLGRALESQMFAVSHRVGRIRFGMFFTVEVLAVLPPALVSALTAQISLRGHWWYYAWMLAVGLAIPWMYREHWARTTTGRKAILLVSAVILALMGTLI
jgi:hypothetical protein